MPIGDSSRADYPYVDDLDAVCALASERPPSLATPPEMSLSDADTETAARRKETVSRLRAEVRKTMGGGWTKCKKSFGACTRVRV